nr:MAG TPA: hypothetical protein [Caudoviricetes sp.]
MVIFVLIRQRNCLYSIWRELDDISICLAKKKHLTNKGLLA